MSEPHLVAAAALDDDRRARQAALDPEQSFIVQAPAGSGKTELLIQRLLAVLAQAEHPSEVLAITFTNKAAGEMRDRLHAALASAQQPESGEMSAVAQARRVLAQRVLARDAERQWKLLDRPDSLMIDTFDAFCARIASRAPLRLVAANAALAPVAESLTSVYREAARSALFDSDITDHGATLLTLAANRVDEVVGLIADLLARRAQWLGEAIDTSDEAVAALTAVLADEVGRGVASIAAKYDARHDDDIRALAAYSAETFALAGRSRQAVQEREALARDWPANAAHDGLVLWRALAAMVLTGGGDLRKAGGVNVAAGFPRDADAAYDAISRTRRSEMKARMQALLEALAGEPHFISALARVRHLPTAAALAEHERALKATLIVLKQAAGYLLLALRDRGVTDFSGVLLAALDALRNSREDVLSGLDARLRHVLVDEVQDTNPAQFELLQLLALDWSPGDGRTLFLVGDPMQSIYAFRDADVSLFLRAQAQGIAGVTLKRLTLTANYRSQPTIVDWVNTELARVFALPGAGATEDTVRVEFVAAVATTAPTSGQVWATECPCVDAADEAVQIADAIAHLRTDEPESSIAVLVRSRAHASDLMAQLAAMNIAFTAREFADWSAREVVRDLLSLTFAVTQPDDRLSLFAVLRSPWVGCTLATLSALAAFLDGDGRSAPACEALRAQSPWQAALDGEERRRIGHAMRAFEVAQARAWLSSPAERIEAVWHALGGPARCATAEAREEVDGFFTWLDGVAVGGALPPRHEVLTLLGGERQSFSSSAGAASPSGVGGTVEVLTIHRAKGLEWDHVFLIGTDRPVRGDARDLAQWRFTASMDDPHERSILIAARDTRRRTEGSVYDFVAEQRTAARLAESKRLLYVAATRARRTLTVSRCNTARTPPAQTFAGLLGYAADSTLPEPDVAADRRLVMPASLRRGPLPAPLAADAIAWPAYRASVDDANVAVPDEQRNARAEGIVGHLLFEGLSLAMAANAAGVAAGFSPDAAAAARALIDAGAVASDAPTIATRLIAWFADAQSRETLKFLFAPDHREAANEWTLPFPAETAGDREVLRVDRTFVTRDGDRWVIDFKFAAPSPTVDVEDWLRSQTESHRPQLRRYAMRLAALDERPPASVRAALYFPWLDRIHEVVI
jgi:ATP-dependent exoDNAse (exonuclease V) beta subunit